MLYVFEVSHPQDLRWPRKSTIVNPLRIPASLRTSQQAFSPLHQPRVAIGQFPRTSHDMEKFGDTFRLAVDQQNHKLIW